MVIGRSNPEVVTTTKEVLYEGLIDQVDSVLSGEKGALVWMSTLCCLIRQQMKFFWVGFYLVEGFELRIGPYQGSLACLRISFDRGVCGAAARRRESIVVPDVHAFPDHIACDSRSRSEIVIPVFDERNQLRAVLDIDSEQPATFDRTDQQYLEKIVARMQTLAWNEFS